MSQKDLSAAKNKRTATQLAAPGQATLAHRAHLNLTAGNGLWLHATPAKEGALQAEPVLYTTMLQRWLRSPFADEDVFCTQCDGVMDKWGDHSLTCCGGGDRTRRHNKVRNLASQGVQEAGLNPELERPGLLPERPLLGARQENGEAATATDDPQARRPADIYVPRFRSGAPAALDFAITSGLRPDVISQSTSESDAALLRYEDFKCSYKDTRDQCQQEGITFVPMVMEASGGGWGKQARKVWTELAKASALASGELESHHGVHLMQRLQFVLHKENARALLHRPPRA